jgi:DNA-directed RNA polymerase specialized sigma24 family protein
MSADESHSLPADDRTSLTLLAKVRDLNDQDAWGRFVARYQPIVLGWCLRKGLQRADADEVAAMVLEKLVRAMPRVDAGPATATNSRGWAISSPIETWIPTLRN